MLFLLLLLALLFLVFVVDVAPVFLMMFPHVRVVMILRKYFDIHIHKFMVWCTLSIEYEYMHMYRVLICSKHECHFSLMYVRACNRRDETKRIELAACFNTKKKKLSYGKWYESISAYIGKHRRR